MNCSKHQGELLESETRRLASCLSYSRVRPNIYREAYLHVTQEMKLAKSTSQTPFQARSGIGTFYVSCYAIICLGKRFPVYET